MWRPRNPQPPITRTELGRLEDRGLVMVANGSEGLERESQGWDDLYSVLVGLSERRELKSGFRSGGHRSDSCL